DRINGCPAARRGAGRYPGRADRIDDRSGGDCADRVRESGEPAAVPRGGTTRRVRRAALDRRDACTAGAPGDGRGIVPVVDGRPAWSADAPTDRAIARAAPPPVR